jgi:anti-sigma B factor antagonist
MTVQVDDHSLPPAVAAAAVRAADAVPYVHPATRVTVERSAVPVFDVVAEPVTGRLDLVGEFDLACGQQFRAASAAILAGGAAEVVVDLTRLRFIDASGIGILIELGNELAVRAATLRIINPDARIGRVFSVCGLDAMLTVPVAP